MKIIIDVPYNQYVKICAGDFDTSGYFKMNLRDAFRNGIPLPKGYDSIKMVTNAEEAKEYPISEDILKRFEEFTKMMFKQGHAESEDKE